MNKIRQKKTFTRVSLSFSALERIKEIKNNIKGPMKATLQ